MQVKYERAANAVYVRFSDARHATTKRISEDVLIDLDANGGLIGIELLDPLADITPVVRRFHLPESVLLAIRQVRESD